MWPFQMAAERFKYQATINEIKSTLGLYDTEINRKQKEQIEAAKDYRQVAVTLDQVKLG